MLDLLEDEKITTIEKYRSLEVPKIFIESQTKIFCPRDKKIYGTY